MSSIDWPFNRTLVMGMIIGMIVAGSGIVESVWAGIVGLATLILIDLIIGWLRRHRTTQETP